MNVTVFDEYPVFILRPAHGGSGDINTRNIGFHGPHVVSGSSTVSIQLHSGHRQKRCVLLVPDLHQDKVERQG